jgi:hypothetical protein
MFALNSLRNEINPVTLMSYKFCSVTAHRIDEQIAGELKAFDGPCVV